MNSYARYKDLAKVPKTGGSFMPSRKAGVQRQLGLKGCPVSASHPVKSYHPPHMPVITQETNQGFQAIVMLPFPSLTLRIDFDFLYSSPPFQGAHSSLNQRIPD